MSSIAFHSFWVPQDLREAVQPWKHAKEEEKKKVEKGSAILKMRLLRGITMWSEGPRFDLILRISSSETLKRRGKHPHIYFVKAAKDLFTGSQEHLGLIPQHRMSQLQCLPLKSNTCECSVVLVYDVLIFSLIIFTHMHDFVIDTWKQER